MSVVPQAASALPATAARTVVVTRDEGADGPLSAHLCELGLAVLRWPVVRVETGAAAAPALARVLERAGEFDWIAFTSRHAVHAVTDVLAAAPAAVRIAAVGEATARQLHERGWPVDLLARQPSAAGLVAAFAARGDVRGARVLYPASSRALPTLARGLDRLGARVEQVQAYRTGSAAADTDTWRASIARGAIGAVTFTSPSAVSELERALGRGDFDRLLASAAAVALGATTGRALREQGHEPVLAEPATLRGLAATTLRILTRR